MITAHPLKRAGRRIGAGIGAALLVLTLTAAAGAQDDTVPARPGDSAPAIGEPAITEHDLPPPDAPADAPDAGQTSEPGDAGEPTSSLSEAGTEAGSGDVPAAEAAPAESVAPLRFAVLAGRSVAVTMAAVDPIADEIGTIIGRPVELLAMTTYRAMIDAQVERRIDGGFYSATAYALAQSRCSCLTPVAAPRAFDGTTAYHAIIVAKARSDIASALDLEGKTVAVGAPDSVGARRMQLAGLMASGIDPSTYFRAVIETPSANDAVLKVRDGEADAAFAWSSLSGDAASGYSRGTLASLARSGAIDPGDFVVVWRSAPITHGPFAVLQSVDEAARDRIGAYLITLEASRPDAYDKLNPFYSGGYAPVAERDYAALETLTAQDVDAVSLPLAKGAPADGAPPDDAAAGGAAAPAAN